MQYFTVEEGNFMNKSLSLWFCVLSLAGGFLYLLTGIACTSVSKSGSGRTTVYYMAPVSSASSSMTQRSPSKVYYMGPFHPSLAGTNLSFNRETAPSVNEMRELRSRLLSEDPRRS
jgi:hypothetical protein